MGLAVLIATGGDSRFSTVGFASAAHAARFLQQDDVKQKAAAASRHLAGVVRDDEGRPVAGATVVAGQFFGGSQITGSGRLDRTGDST